MHNRICRRETKQSYSGKQYFNSELDKFSVVLLALLALEFRFQDFELVLLILERFSVELCTRKKRKINIKICKLMTGNRYATIE